MAFIKNCSVVCFLILLLVICLRDTENKIAFEILDICRLLINSTFEFLKLISLRVESIEIGHITVKFNHTVRKGNLKSHQ